MSKMKFLTTVTALGLASVAPALAFFPMGNDAELFVTGTGDIEYNSNIFLAEDAKSDTILTLAPGILIPFGQNSATKGQLSISEDFQIFSSHSELNDELLNASFTAAMDDGKMKLSTNASFREVNQNNRDVAGAGIIARRDVSNLSVLGEVSATAKTKVSAGINYSDTSYKLGGFADLQSFEVPLRLYYALTPQVDVSGGFRYKDNEVGGTGIDSKEYFYSVGARGDLLPKLTGELAAGYNVKDFATGGTRSALGLESEFSYAASAKTELNFGVRSSFGYSGAGAAYDILGFNAAVQIAAQDELTVTAAASFTSYDYTVSGRKDDFLDLSIRARYLVNAFLTLSGGISYNDNASTLAGSDFSATKLNFGGSIRY